MKLFTVFVIFVVGVFTCKAQLHKLVIMLTYSDEQCRIFTGDEEHYQNSTDKFNMCVNSVGEILNREYQDENITYWKGVCSKISLYESCLVEHWNSCSYCLGEDERVVSELAGNITHHILSFMCNNDGEGIIRFLNSGGTECLNFVSKNIEECVKTQIQDFQNKTFVSDETACSKLNDVESCFVKSMRECKDQTPGDLAKEFLEAVNVHLPCQTKQKEDKSGSTQ